jgi:hypothetical protein
MTVSIPPPPDFIFPAGEYPRNPELDDPRYLLGDAAAVAEISTTLLKAWLTREPRVVRFGPYDHRAHGKGSARLFTLRRVLCVSLIAELTRLGLSASHAGRIAYMTTDAEFPSLGSTIPAHREDVILVLYPDHELSLYTGSGDSLRAVLERKGRQPVSSPAVSFLAVSCKTLFERVRTRLAEREGKHAGQPISPLDAA